MIKKLIKVELPDEYQKVEWLGVNAPQNIFIDTNVFPNENTKLEMSVTFLNYPPRYESPMGVENTANDYLFRPFIATNDSRLQFRGGGVNHTFDLVENSNYDFTFGNGVASNGITTYYYNKTPFTADYSLHLFGINRRNANNDGGMNFRIKSCKIYDDTELIRNFVPCYRKNDNVAGMYDLVSNTFFTNGGRGDFVVGLDLDYYSKEIKAIKRYIPYVGLVNFLKVIKGANQLLFSNDNLFELRKFILYNSSYSLNNGVLAVSRGAHSDCFITDCNSGIEYLRGVLKSGNSYRIAFDAKCDAAPNRSLWFHYANRLESTDTSQKFEYHINGTGEWEHIEFNYTPKEDMGIRLYAPFNSSATTQYYKDIVITKLN